MEQRGYALPRNVKYAADGVDNSGEGARPDRVIRDFIAGGNSLRILVSEDEIINQKFLEKTIERIGFPADLANDGLTAIEMIRRNRYDLIFLDMQMPVLSGEEVLAVMKEEGLIGRTYIIAQTAYSMGGDAEKYLAMGCDIYLTKPVDTQRLIEVIAAAIRHISGGTSG